MWPQILYNKPETAPIACEAMGTELDEVIWSCNVHGKDVPLVCKRATPFWKDILAAWFSFTYDSNVNTSDQVIWNNSYIRINNVPFLWKKPFKKGLVWLQQLYPDGVQISEEAAEETYGLNFLDLRSIIAAVPNKWKVQLNSATQAPPPNMTYMQYLYRKNLSAYVYSRLMNREDVIFAKSGWTSWKS